jgi:integrase
LISYHPIKGKVTKLSTPPRDRYIKDWELTEALSVANPVVHAYISPKVLTGLRRGDLLRLKNSDLKDDGIHVQPNKTAKTTGKRIIIEWSPALREAVQAAKAARPKDIVPWLFCTRQGKPYVLEDGSASAFDSLWQRFMRKALEKSGLEERFTEHDLRAKCGSDASSLEHAQQLLAHADSSTTKRNYRRRAERVKPLK